MVLFAPCFDTVSQNFERARTISDACAVNHPDIRSSQRRITEPCRVLTQNDVPNERHGLRGTHVLILGTADAGRVRYVLLLTSSKLISNRYPSPATRRGSQSQTGGLPLIGSHVQIQSYFRSCDVQRHGSVESKMDNEF